MSYFDLFSRLASVFTVNQPTNQVNHEVYTEYLQYVNFVELYFFKIQRHASNSIQSYPMTWGAVLVKPFGFFSIRNAEIGLWVGPKLEPQIGKHLGHFVEFRNPKLFNLNSKGHVALMLKNLKNSP